MNSDNETIVHQLFMKKMKELGTLDYHQHQVIYSRPVSSVNDPLRMIWEFGCSCGWKAKRTSKDMLTTMHPVLEELLVEHAMYHTDPNHYTYYPAHAR